MGKNILASSSPRRADILKDKFIFEIVPSPYEEIHSTTVFSYEYVENLAYNKAKAVIPLVDNDSIIIGADTVVVLNNKILEKPKDSEDAKRMLRELSNRTHQVVTAIAVINTKNLKHIIQDFMVIFVTIFGEVRILHAWEKTIWWIIIVIKQ